MFAAGLQQVSPIISHASFSQTDKRQKAFRSTLVMFRNLRGNVKAIWHKSITLYCVCVRQLHHFSKISTAFKTRASIILLGMPLEIWVLGAILTIVGLLSLGCSFGHGEFGLYLPAAGITSVGIGSLVFLTKFKKWVESL